MVVCLLLMHEVTMYYYLLIEHLTLVFGTPAIISKVDTEYMSISKKRDDTICWQILFAVYIRVHPTKILMFVWVAGVMFFKINRSSKSDDFTFIFSAMPLTTRLDDLKSLCIICIS